MNLALFFDKIAYFFFTYCLEGKTNQTSKQETQMKKRKKNKKHCM